MLSILLHAQDPLPSDVFGSHAGVELQLPASDDAWAHHLAEAARYERLVHPDRPCELSDSVVSSCCFADADCAYISVRAHRAVGEQSVSVTDNKTMDDGKVYYELT